MVCNMKIDVPYYSQYIDITDPFWMLRACGAVSYLMLAESHDLAKRDIVSFCNEAKDKGGYHKENGWVHDFLIEKAISDGFEAYRKEGIEDLSDIANYLQKGNPVIVSVEKRVLEQKRFHMLLLTGYEKNEEGEVTHVYYHEPEATTVEKGKYRMCTKEEFMEYFRGKALFISKK